MTSVRPTFEHQSSDLDLKQSQSASRDHDNLDESTTPTPGVWATFLGTGREKLAKDPIVWHDGAGPLFSSVLVRAKTIFTKRFLACLIAGQALSMAITGTSVLTTELNTNGWSLPCTQTLFMYFLLNCIYTPFTIYKYGWRAYGKMLVTDGYKYIFLAAVDVEANFLVVKAYGYTDLLSCMLLDAWATPACMIFAFFFVKARYHWTQVLGVLIAIAGLGLLVTSDFLTDKNYPAENKVLGDWLMIIGATGYGLSNSLEEMFVRKRPLYEVVGQMGFWGSIINGIQGSALEHHLYHEITWNGTTVGYLLGYTFVMLFLYTLAPILYRLSSSPFYNLSILTSDFYGLAIGLTVFGYAPYWLYFVAYPLVLSGLVVYFMVARPEATSDLKVVARGNQLEREERSGKANVIGDARI
ncbi:hypothetical protein MNV49_003506 [Pseudohyphozyma bogoriensis]|nr:hypothetical protein MNV49_003502 [Pseudohyphozyma bogoriensis]KAI5474354.1 hypothetical protein MNV49_003506 [Pseudohyphozyma bogoriensis]